MNEVDYIEAGKEAIAFRDSPRGQYIMAQALYLGIKALYLHPEPMREVSNAFNMKYLLDILHPGMFEVFEKTQAPLVPNYTEIGRYQILEEI